ncbi:MAG: FAD-containing oxidoreductase [Labilithrix sp.]|nr:FAD-containing oxidoreductase [Labilithrix sp.]
MKRFDAIVIGAGQAGPSLASRLTSAGMSVAVIERKLFGGTCVNTGCMPTKTLVASARAAHVARHASDWGVVVEGAVSVDMKRVKARADAVSSRSRTGIESWLEKMDRCTVFRDHARFTSAHTVRVGDDELSAERIFINVGGRARVPPLRGLDRVSYLTNTTILALDEVPRHLVVVGGSYVGLEYAQMYRRFGSEVTVVEMGPRLVSREDPEVSAAIREILEREGVAFRLDAKCISLAPAEGGVSVGVDCARGDPAIAGSHVLLAVGRQPNTEDLGLDRAGVKVDAHGYVVVDDELRTNVDGVWALGDCNGRGAFTHTAYNDYEIVAANLLDGDRRRLSDRIVAYALYIDPPLGRAGLTETEAASRGRPLLVGRRPMSRVGRAIEKGETQGFMKIIVDAETKKILGAAILGTEGDEAVHGILDVMYAGATATTLQRTVPIHPTVSELIPTVLAEAAPPAG